MTLPSRFCSLELLDANRIEGKSRERLSSALPRASSHHFAGFPSIPRGSRRFPPFCISLHSASPDVMIARWRLSICYLAPCGVRIPAVWLRATFALASRRLKRKTKREQLLGGRILVYIHELWTGIESVCGKFKSGRKYICDKYEVFVLISFFFFFFWKWYKSNFEKKNELRLVWMFSFHAHNNKINTHALQYLHKFAERSLIVKCYCKNVFFFKSRISSLRTVQDYYNVIKKMKRGYFVKQKKKLHIGWKYTIKNIIIFERNYTLAENIPWKI